MKSSEPQRLWQALVIQSLVIALSYFAAITRAEDAAPAMLDIERTVMTRGYDATMCWVHARVGAIPSTGEDSLPMVVMTSQPLMLKGSDAFYALNSSRTLDLGKSWSPFTPQPGFERKEIDEHTEETVSDFAPGWHQASGKLLGIGHTVRYFDNRVMAVRPRFTAYSVYDPIAGLWGKPKTMKMPDEVRFENCGAGSVQRHDLPDGNILLPVYFKAPESTQLSVAVCLCRFDGDELTYVEHGSELSLNVTREFAEPSITKFDDRFFLTLRNDEHGYVATSSDGLHYDRPQQWTFDDGSDLGNYNTQQHWVTTHTGLYLVYTRRGADNDHVFRHRARFSLLRLTLKSCK